MDKEKEGVLRTIADAAKTSMDAVTEGLSSAANSIAEAVTGTTKKPRRRRRRSTTKKAATSRRRTTTRRGKAKRPSKRGTGSALPLARAHERQPGQHARRSGAPRNLGGPPGAAHAKHRRLPRPLAALLARPKALMLALRRLPFPKVSQLHRRQRRVPRGALLLSRAQE
jgi:hypothetical protein